MDKLTELLERALYKHKQGKLCGTGDLYKSLIGSLGESKVVELTEGVLIITPDFPTSC